MGFGEEATIAMIAPKCQSEVILAFLFVIIASHPSEKWPTRCSTCSCSSLTWVSHVPRSSGHSSVLWSDSWCPGSCTSTACHCRPSPWPCRSRLQTQPTSAPWQSEWCRCSPRKLMKLVSALQVTRQIKARYFLFYCIWENVRQESWMQWPDTNIYIFQKSENVWLEILMGWLSTVL